MNTKMIVGLGNPINKIHRCGKRINTSQNRHNIGFKIVDAIVSVMNARRLLLKCSERKLVVNTFRYANNNIVLLKPLDWMNSSGIAVGQAKRALDIKSEDVIVIYDDMDFDFGTVRVKYNGRSGGHNGIKSVIDHVGKGFSRVRIGIGRPTEGDPYDYVLSNFTWAEQKYFCELYNLCVSAIKYWVEHGVQKTMCFFNQKRKEEDNGKV